MGTTLRTALGLVAALLLGACASAKVADTPARAASYDPVYTDVDGRVVRATRTTDASRTTLAGSPDRAYAAVEKVYGELGIPVLTREPAARRLGNTRHTVRRQLAGASLSVFLDCGNTMGGRAADQYRVQMNVVSTLVPVPDDRESAALLTIVSATAVNDAGHSAESVFCSSTGALEERIAKRSQLALFESP